MAKISSNWSYKDGRSYKGNNDYPIPDKLVGIELEIENVRNHKRSFTLWNLDNDGSLRNGGLEFQSLPIMGEDIDSAFEEVKDVLAASSFGFRTSVHIHLDMRHEDTTTLFNVVEWYPVLEPIFYQLSGNRDSSVFCTPWATSYRGMIDILVKISRMMAVPKGTDLKEYMYSCFSEFPKYTGLNMAPLLSYGTIEFRHHEGTGDIPKIKFWIKVIQKFLLFCRTTQKKPTGPMDAFSLIWEVWGKEMGDQIIQYISETYVEINYKYLSLYTNAYKLLNNNRKVDWSRGSIKTTHGKKLIATLAKIVKEEKIEPKPAPELVDVEQIRRNDIMEQLRIRQAAIAEAQAIAAGVNDRIIIDDPIVNGPRVNVIDNAGVVWGEIAPQGRRG